MRPIKFRLISPEGIVVGYEKWYPGRFNNRGIQTSEPMWRYSHDGKFWNSEKIWHTKKDAFTGLTDKNGKEVFEGDILSCVVMHDCNIEHWKMAETESIAVPFAVRFDEQFAAFMVPCHTYEFEVIGNCFENPELLENK